jgi:hypothetical protein
MKPYKVKISADALLDIQEATGTMNACKNGELVFNIV